MSIVINTNVSSILVQKSLSNSTGNIQNSLQKLSTGFRINKAADDAAGLTISESLKSQARGAQVAQSNAQTGINLLQTAEGDLSIIQDNLQRIRDLSVQAANGTNGTKETSAIIAEVNQRVAEINRISESSQFNGINLLDGSKATANSVTLQIGTNSAAATNAIDISSVLKNADATSLSINTVFTDQTSAAAYIGTVDTAINTVSSTRSSIGSFQNRLESAIQSLGIQYENMSASESRIRDVDVAKEAANLTKNQILQQSSAQLLAQANQAPQVALSLI